MTDLAREHLRKLLVVVLDVADSIPERYVAVHVQQAIDALDDPNWAKRMAKSP